MEEFLNNLAVWQLLSLLAGVGIGCILFVVVWFASAEAALDNIGYKVFLWIMFIAGLIVALVDFAGTDFDVHFSVYLVLLGWPTLTGLAAAGIDDC